jgi:hypothetical protein
MPNPSRMSNRSIIWFGLALCIAVAVLAAYMLGLFQRA